MSVEIQELSTRMPVPAEMLEYVKKFVPRYRQLGIRYFRDLPPARKEEMMRNIPHYVSEEFAEIRQRLSDLVQDREAAGEVSNNQFKPIPGVLVEQTTGTSGMPGRFPKTNAERTRLAMGIWKYRRKIDPGVSPDKFLPFVHLPFGQKEDPRIHGSDVVEIRAVYDEAVRKQVRWLHAQPRMVCGHIKRFNEAGYPRMPGFIRVCETTSETLSPVEKQTVADYFDCKLLNQFGCIETWAFGYDETGTGEMDVLTDNVFLELLNPETYEPITRIGETGLLALTSLHLRLLPIVRYLNGDRAEWTLAGERVKLRLHQDRQINMLLLNGKLVPGAEVVRVWLNIAFIRMGYLQMEFIQFVQTAEFEITVRIGACAKGPKLWAEIQKVVAETTTTTGAIHLVYEEVSAEGIAQELKRKKYLFVSRLNPI